MNLNNDDMFYLAKKVVLDKYKDAELKLDDGSDYTLTQDGVFIVWFSKTLQNWKAMVSTIVNDGMYYEVTFDGSINQLYLDSYEYKEHNAFNVSQIDPNEKKEESEEEALVEEPVEEEVAEA